MANDKPLEIVFYIHGVSPNRDGASHTSSYKTLHEGIRQAGVHADFPGEFGGAEWGWNFDGGEADSHKALTEAQKQLGDEVLPLISAAKDFTLNPARLLVNGLRSLVFFGFGDMFYYVSADGKRAVRREVARQILEHVNGRLGGHERPISLTLLGHSAGSVIAFDFLYYLFNRRSHDFLKDGSDEATQQGIQWLRQLAQSGRLQVRRLITFGSPISLVAFRSDALVEITGRGEKLRSEDYGLTSQVENHAAPTGARWINLWDKDDPIAWPIAPVMDSQLAQDVYVDVSCRVSAAHDAYWKSPKVHKKIASMW